MLAHCVRLGARMQKVHSALTFCPLNRWINYGVTYLYQFQYFYTFDTDRTLLFYHLCFKGGCDFIYLKPVFFPEVLQVILTILLCDFPGCKKKKSFLRMTS